MKRRPWAFFFVVSVAASTAFAKAPAGRYVLANGTVTDTKTQLVWQQVDGGAIHRWADVQSVCASLALDGGGWRVPMHGELLTLLDPSELAAPYIDPAFIGVGDIYWTATPSEPDASANAAYFVSFGTAASNLDNNTAKHLVRCVR